MSLPPLKVKIGADTQGLTSGVDQANKKLGSMTGTANKVGRSIDNISKRAKKLGGAMSKIAGAAALVAGGLAAMTKASAENANRIDKAARTAGLSTEAFQEMAFAVGQVADISDGQFANAMQKLQRRSGEAAKGNKTYAEALDKVGVSSEAVQSGAITTEEIFSRLNDAMGQFESQAEAVSVASALLGEEDGPKIAAAMRENTDALEENRKKARETGQVISGEMIDASVKMVDQLDVLSGQWEKLRADLAEKIIPLMVETLIPAIQDKVIPALASFVEKIGEVITWFQDLPGPVQEALALVATALGVGGPVMLALGALTGALKAALLATGPIGLFIAAAALAVAAWQKWGDDIKAAVGAAIDWITEKFDAFMAKIQAIIDKAKAVKTAISDALTLGGSGGLDPESPVGRAGGPMGSSLRGGGGQADASGGSGGDIINGVVGGMEAGVEENEERIRGVYRRLDAIAREELEIQSPSKVFDRIGRHIGEGMAGGIESTVGLSQRAMEQHKNATTKTALEATDGILGAMGKLFDNSKPIAMAQAIINTYQGITEALKLPFPKNLAAAATVAAEGFAAVKGIQSTNKSGGGGGSGGAAAAGGGGQGASPRIVLNVQPNERGDVPMETFTSLIDTINDERSIGGRIIA